VKGPQEGNKRNVAKIACCKCSEESHAKRKFGLLVVKKMMQKMVFLCTPYYDLLCMYSSTLDYLQGTGI
jgi:hypothetical protein